jgi:predicted O-methyltransferase YrrM
MAGVEAEERQRQYWTEEVARAEGLYKRKEHSLPGSVRELGSYLSKLQVGGHPEKYFKLYLLSRAIKPSIIVETGVHYGVSTLFLLSALNANARGRLFSIDVPTEHYSKDDGVLWSGGIPESKIGLYVEESLKARWSLEIGRSATVLPNLMKRLAGLDLFVHDSEHTYGNMMSEFRTAWPGIQSKGVLVADDVDWSRAFEDFCMEVGTKAIYLVEKQVGLMVKN